MHYWEKLLLQFSLREKLTFPFSFIFHSELFCFKRSFIGKVHAKTLCIIKLVEPRFHNLHDIKKITILVIRKLRIQRPLCKVCKQGCVIFSKSLRFNRFLSAILFKFFSTWIHLHQWKLTSEHFVRKFQIVSENFRNITMLWMFDSKSQIILQKWHLKKLKH